MIERAVLKIYSILFWVKSKNKQLFCVHSTDEFIEYATFLFQFLQSQE